MSSLSSISDVWSDTTAWSCRLGSVHLEQGQIESDRIGTVAAEAMLPVPDITPPSAFSDGVI